MKHILWTLLISLFLITLMSCSGSSSPVEVVAEPDQRLAFETPHCLWGLWEVTADPDNATLDFTRLRMSQLHLNALPFLEPPVNSMLTVESVQFNGNILEVDIGLRHPFLGLTEFTGFDVKGILISNGSVSGFEDTELVMVGEGDTKLLNPDGYTRWWNPSEFPITGTIFGYTDGLLGVPHSMANYTSTINGYKFFCDDITFPSAHINSVPVTSRCTFTAGQKNVRHYTIEVGDDGLIFNYAIDASWKYPVGPSPWDVPGSFVPDANCPEAWNIIATETENTLWNDGDDSGGDLELQIHVWDHFDAVLNIVKIESPGNFDAVASSTPVGGGEGYSTYEIDVSNATPSPDAIEILVTVECEKIGYQGILPGANVSAYFVFTSQVYDDPPPPPNPGKIAWTSNRDGNPEIYTMVADGTAQTRLTFYSDHDWEASWSPDGSEIAWRRGGYETSNIWVMNEDGSSQHQVSSGGWNFDPDWGPEGEWIYFWSYNGEGSGIHLWKVRPNGNDQQQVTFFDDSTVAGPQISPNNDLVAYEGPGPGGGPRDLWVCDIDGTNPQHLTETPTWESYPHWNSDGTKLCLSVENPGGVFSIWTINPDGTGLEQVSVPPSTDDDFSACWGYNDEELIISRRMGAYPNDEIIRYYIATGEYDQLTDDDEFDWYPDWHPNDSNQ